MEIIRSQDYHPKMLHWRLVSFNFLLRGSGLALAASIKMKVFLDSEPYFIKPDITPLLKDNRRLKGMLEHLVGCNLKLSDTFAIRLKKSRQMYY